MLELIRTTHLFANQLVLFEHWHGEQRAHAGKLDTGHNHWIAPDVTLLSTDIGDLHNLSRSDELPKRRVRRWLDWAMHAGCCVGGRRIVHRVQREAPVQRYEARTRSLPAQLKNGMPEQRAASKGKQEATFVSFERQPAPKMKLKKNRLQRRRHGRHARVVQGR
jgi:hypothetical protein